MIQILGLEVELKIIIVPIIYIIIGIVSFKILKNVISKMVEKRNLKGSKKQRVDTLKVLLINIIKYLTIIFVVLAILSVFGVNVKSIVAGLGIGTAVIGLAFKDLATDLIAGFNIITEGEYEIGDTIEVDGFMGEVVFIGLRTTRIRDFKGATKIIANHYMDNIINYSESNSLAVVDVSIAYECKEEDIDKAFEQLKKNLEGKIPNATGELEVWGVNSLSDSAVVYRVVVETKPMQQFATQRFLKREIKKQFDKSNIKIPYQQIEVHNGK